MYCHRCGTQLVAESNFCHSCGVAKAPPPAARPAPLPEPAMPAGAEDETASEQRATDMLRPRDGRFASLTDAPVFSDCEEGATLTTVPSGAELDIEGETSAHYAVRVEGGELGYVRKAAGMLVRPKPRYLPREDLTWATAPAASGRREGLTAYCSSCRSLVHQTGQYCGNCGAPLVYGAAPVGAAAPNPFSPPAYPAPGQYPAGPAQNDFYFSIPGAYSPRAAEIGFLGRILFLLGSVGLIASPFLPWVSASFLFVSAEVSLYDMAKLASDYSAFTEVMVIAGVALVGSLLRLSRVINVLWARVWAVIAGGAGLVEFAYRYAKIKDAIGSDFGLANLEIGFYLLAIASVAVVVGAMIDRD